MSRLEFNEVQPFWKQPLIWPIWILFVALVYYLLVNDLILDVVGYIVIGMALASSFLIFLMRLVTSIDTSGVSYRMRPFHRKWKHHDWSEIAHWEVRKYKAIREYGGYGIRIGLQGKAYNIKGNMGLQLVLKDGKRILIGTQDPDIMQDTIKRLRREAG